MKKLLGMVILAFVAFILYTDFTNGTIVHSIQTEPSQTSSVEVVAEQGDTLLVLLKEHDLLPPSFNIDQLSSEFSSLNNGIAPHEMVAGERYLLPVPD